VGESMRLREANGKMAIQLTKAEIDEVIKTHLLNNGYASDHEVEYAFIIKPHEMDCELTGAFVLVEAQEWTVDNCPMIREQGAKHPYWGRPESYPDGTCLGYGCAPYDDEPHNLCKKCVNYAGAEEP